MCVEINTSRSPVNQFLSLDSQKTVVLQNPSKMRGRDASLVKPMSFGVGSLAIGSAHCPHAPPGTGLVASNLVSIKVHTILDVHDILLMERNN